MSDEFKKYLEAQRTKFITLTELQDRELARLYIETAAELKIRFQDILANKTLTSAQVKIRINSLLREASRLSNNFEGILDKALISSADLGKEVNKIALSQYQRSLTNAGYDLKLTRILNKTSKEAVTYTYSKIWNDGLKLSDRVWLLNRRTKQEIERIVMQNVVAGGSASDRLTLSALENLLNPKYTPAKLTSLHGRKVSYEASRLLRTEMAISFNEADRLSSNLNPGSKGLMWLSASGCCEICDENDGKNTNETGIPPAHPNCRCSTTEDIISVEQFTSNWIAYMENPASQPELAEWYKEVYEKAA